MAKEKVIHAAKFKDKVCTYWLLSGIVTCVITIIGIPFLLLWIPLGLIFTRRYLNNMECVLTPTALKVKKGILVKVEKTIPLEKITDMGMRQGPIMRAFDLHTLTIETAGGQAGPTGALVGLTGIENALDFREMVLEQRDSGRTAEPPPAIANSTDATHTDLSELKDVLVEIRDTLKRIETKSD